MLFQLLSVAAPLFTIPYVSRVFGPENLGIYSYTSTIAHYFIIIAMLGLSSYGSRTIAMNRDNKDDLSRTFWEIYFMQVITSALAILLYILLISFLFKSYFAISFVLIIYVASSALDINWFFHGLERFKLTVIGNSIIKILSVISVFVFVKTSNDLWIYTLIHASSTFLVSLILWFYLFRTIKFVSPSLNNVMGHFKPNIILFVPVIAVSIYKYMDKIMLGSFSKIEAGYYENAEKLITLVAGFITSFGTVMLPKVSNLAAKGDDKSVKDSIEGSLRFVIGLSCAFAFGLSSVASVFVPLYFGEGFEPCIPIIYCLSFTLIFSSWSTVIRTQFLIPFKKDKVYLAAEFLGAGVNLVLNIILISQFGAMGAVYGTIVAEIVVTVYQTFMIRRDIKTKKFILQCIPFLFAGFLMYCVVQFVLVLGNFSILSMFIAIPIGAILYIMFWFIFEKRVNNLKVIYNE